MPRVYPYVLLFCAFGLISSCSALPRANSHSDFAVRTKTSETPLIATPGPCSSLRASHPTPISAGRGDHVVLAKDGARTIAYVANEDDASLHTIDVGAHQEIAVTSLTGAPSALVALRDGRIAVALRDKNEVVVMEPASDLAAPLEERCSRSVATEPVGLAANEKSGQDEVILVASGYGHSLTELNDKDLQVIRRVDLKRDPRAVFVNDGSAFVSHVSSSELSVVDLETGGLRSINLLGEQKTGVTFRSSASQPLEPAPIRGGQVFALTSSEGRLYAPMVAVDPGPPQVTGGYGGIEEPIKPFVGEVDLTAMHELPIAVPSQTQPQHRACMLPRAAAADSAGRLFVACAGIDELLELDGHANNAIHAIRRRVALPSGPLGLAIDDRVAVVFAQFDHEVAIVPLSGDAPLIRVGLSRRAATHDAAFEHGRKMFHDSFDLRVSANGRACASCHPDGRDDGNTWSTPDGPRQTITLAGRLSNSGPYGWFGEHPTLDGHMRETMHRLGGLGFEKKRDREDLADLESYIVQMKAPTVERLDAPAIEKGHALFSDARQGCAECHAEGSSDHAKHDVGSGNREEKSLSFDTPSLAYVGSSGPYFHDGRYATLDDLLAKGDDRMGHTKQLDTDERASLVAYMESLAPSVNQSDDFRTGAFVSAPALGPLERKPISTMEAVALRDQPPTLAFERLDVALADIPVLNLSAPVVWDTKSPTLDADLLPANGIVWKNGCAAIPYHAAAMLRLDWREAQMTRGLDQCVGAPDPNGVQVWSPVLMKTIDPAANGKIHFVERQGFIRMSSHEIRLTREVSVDAVPIGGGVAFAYRTECPDCKLGERSALHLISSSDGGGFFSWSQVSLEPNQASNTVVTLEPSGFALWTKLTGLEIDNPSIVGKPRRLILAVDASRTASEAEARIGVGRATCSTDRFRCF